ncbi:MAG TPA: ATP-binding cassette domain-containing protein [Anaerolineaceae bacterium]
MKPLLQAVELTKSFGSLPVIRQVSFEILPGEVVGLTGSIGSGKSVLVSLLSGQQVPNTGELFFQGNRLTWPFSANKLGIGVIHQRPTLDDRQSVVSNVFLGNEIGWPGWLRSLRLLDNDQMLHKASRILNELNVEIGSMNSKVTDLTGEQRQLIAIARVMTLDAKLIIIDEPTVLLSYPYQQRLLSLIHSWRERGVAVLFSSNNLDHLFAVTDRILVLHQGSNVADMQTDQTNREAVVSLLLGDESAKKQPMVWDYDNYNRVREQTEKLRYSQILLGKDLTGEASLSRQLTEQLAEQVQALDQANLVLLETQRRLLSEHEEERKHLSRELHDQIIQDLLSINYELESMETEVSISPTMADDLTEVRQGIRILVENLRRICGNLRPLTIDSLGLGAALQSLARDWSARTGIKVDVHIDSNLVRLPEATELSLFRIVQEGLNNVWRHAQATRVRISVQHTSPRMLEVAVQDNGNGSFENVDLASLSASGHYGLVGISERVAMLGGRFRLQRMPEGGALLLVEIPHARVENAAEIP